MKKNTVLIVDDTEINRILLSDILGEEYHILEAANGVEALACIKQHSTDISLVLLDIVMPKMDGFEVLTTLNKSNLIDTLPVIIISAETSATYMDHAYELGAVEYIRRPFEPKEVQRRVKNTIMLYTKQRELENMVTDQILEKEKSNMMMVEILSHIVEFRNGESGMHVLHIRIITEALLKNLCKTDTPYQLTAEEIALITNASALHDIGKISISEQILNKPGKLTPEEFEVIKNHSKIGAQMLETIPFYQDESLVKTARDICLWHHERYDGRGYPDGLKGDEIPISAQVVSLADVYDALTSKRVYKDAYSHQTSLKMILKGECGIFNPVLLDCLVDIAPDLERQLQNHSIKDTTRSELEKIPHNLLRNSITPSRTLSLLEQERSKHQFYISLTNEILFEYTCQTDLLTMSEHGASLLGISPVIVHPLDDVQVKSTISHEEIEDIRTRLRTATFECPTVVHDYFLNISGEAVRYRMYARPLWTESDSLEITSYIGKFTKAEKD